MTHRVLAFRLLCLLLFASLASGCGPSAEDLAAQVATAAAATVAAAPTVTPYPTYTPASTAAPYPTVTPAPTATPYPTYTPLPPVPTAVPSSCPLWTVEIVEASAIMEFDRFYVDSNGRTRLVAVSVEFSCQGADGVDFYPESVVLVHVGDEMTGWAKTADLFQSESLSGGTVIDFSKSAASWTLSGPDIDGSATFVYEFPKEYTDFELLFPGSTPIPISLQ